MEYAKGGDRNDICRLMQTTAPPQGDRIQAEKDGGEMGTMNQENADPSQ